MKKTLESFKEQEIEEIKAILREGNLPISDINEDNIRFFVIKADEEIIGIIGLERYNGIGLLRSLAVKDRYKKKGVGRQLIDTLVGYAKEQNLQELYLLTTTTEKYFERFGFENIERCFVPVEIVKSRQFSKICPSSATIMKKIIRPDLVLI